MFGLNIESIAIGISLLSLMVAAFALGWNVYRDVILKPRLRVRVNISDVVGNAGRAGTFAVVQGTNFGPGDIGVEMVHGRNAPLWRRLLRCPRNFVVIHDYQNPLSGQLPTRLATGEKIDLLFEFNADCFLKAQPTHIGLRDSFGRTHWASRSEVREATKLFREDLPAETTR